MVKSYIIFVPATILHRRTDQAQELLWKEAY